VSQVLLRANPGKSGKKYKILDNGGYPFTAVVYKSKVELYINELGGPFFNQIVGYKGQPKVYHPKKVFVGKDPKTGKDVGNSILLDMGKMEYIFIGWNVTKFKAKSKITKYVSPVGNSAVPYPYAIDEDGNYYLMLENVMLDGVSRGEDPYRVYYQDKKLGKKYKASVLVRRQ